MSESGGIIAFLSDFGGGSIYPALVKGVAKRINPGLSIIDLTHDVPPFNVSLGAFFLLSSCRWLPGGTVFLAVVDPGVGGDRRALIVSTERYIFVGPDNGLIYPAAKREGIVSTHVIKRGRYTLESGCDTFHGRDVFAPIAAHLSLGVPPAELGLESEMPFPLHIPEETVDEHQVTGTVLFVDPFGNVVTSVRSSAFTPFSERADSILINGKHAVPARTFSDIPEGRLGIVPGSLERVEVGAFRGSAAMILGVEVGDLIRFVKE